MTPDEHQRERMRAWAGFARVTATFADERLCEFDKRFPAPTAVEVAPISPDERHDYAMLAKEVGILRNKARLWDAVADGAINLSYYESAGFQASWSAPAANGGTARCGSGSKHTAAEAVQAAIDAGALK